MAERSREVPMHRSDFSVLDSEFNSIRERFDAEMSKMEEEMAKFRQELLSRESSIFSRTGSGRDAADGLKNFKKSQQSASSTWKESVEDGTRYSESCETKEFHAWSSDSGKGSSPPPFQSVFQSNGVKSQANKFNTSLPSDGAASQRSWLDGLNSPLIQEVDNGKVLKLRFDVSQYAPEEIVVKTVDNKLNVHAKHEEKTDNRSTYREYNREFLLPKYVNPESICSSLSRDGVLTVEAPLPASIPSNEKLISIEHR